MSASRREIARRLGAAYGDGLISQDTFVHRLDMLLDDGLVDPQCVAGDLTFRSSRRGIRAAIDSALRRLGADAPEPGKLLALDWTGTTQELLVGRRRDCDVVLSNPTVSRRHARIFFRDGRWILQDLRSTNGTTVNGVRVGRCELRPGDVITFGEEHLKVD